MEIIRKVCVAVSALDQLHYCTADDLHSHTHTHTGLHIIPRLYSSTHTHIISLDNSVVLFYLDISTAASVQFPRSPRALSLSLW